MAVWRGSLEGMGMRSFWKGKKVLVTGHTGFKGGWLSLWLQQLGAEVVGLSLDPPTAPSFYQRSRVVEGMVSVQADIRDGDQLKAIFDQHQPEILFHLAAQSLVRYSYRSPVETYETNVMGTLHLLEAMRHTETTQAALMITTDKCYENREWVWGYRENEPMGGHDPYSSSKGAMELLIASYRNSYYPKERYQQHGVAIASARAGNVIGGGDWGEDRLIPDMIRAFQQGEAVNIRSPHAIRPWQHVLEPLFGYLQLSEKLYTEGAEYAEPWNFGSVDQDAMSVQWIVERLTQLWGKGAAWTLDQGTHPHEAHYLKLDCSKAHSRLQWKPKWSLEMTLEKIVEWHQLESEHGDMRGLSISQIEQYLSEAN